MASIRQKTNVFQLNGAFHTIMPLMGNGTAGMRLEIEFPPMVSKFAANKNLLIIHQPMTQIHNFPLVFS